MLALIQGDRAEAVVVSHGGALRVLLAQEVAHRDPGRVDAEDYRRVGLVVNRAQRGRLQQRGLEFLHSLLLRGPEFELNVLARQVDQWVRDLREIPYKDARDANRTQERAHVGEVATMLPVEDYRDAVDFRQASFGGTPVPDNHTFAHAGQELLPREGAARVANALQDPHHHF